MSMSRLILALCLVLPGAAAEGEQPGRFDYYVMALSWSPNWCAAEGQGAQQCGQGLDWVLHGLWPQNERGWPSYCAGPQSPPSRAQTRAMADIMGTAGSAFYQWKKHGTCAGLSAADYFDAAREGYDSVTRPAIFRQLPREMELAASVVEEAWLEANPDLEADGLTVTCKAGAIQEVRICLTKELEPRRCGADVIRDCTLSDAVMQPVE